MTAITYCNLGLAIAPIRREIDNAIAGCIDQSSFLHGFQTRTFEEEWAAFCGQQYAVCCNSGTDALTLAATALGLQSVRIPANTLPLTGIGLFRGGARVNIAEINAEGWMAMPGGDAVPVLIYGRIPAETACTRYRDGLMAWLARHDIGCKIHWAKALHRVPGPWEHNGHYPESEKWADSILSLPCYPGLKTSEINRVCDAVEEYYATQ